MKFLFDLFPVILFFGSFKWAEGHTDAAHAVVSRYLGDFMAAGLQPAQAPVILATVIAIVATFCQVGYLLARKRKVDGMLWFSLAIIVVFGGLTVYFHDENFIKLKPTILYVAMAVLLLVSQVIFKKNLMRKAMEEQIKLPEQMWARLGYAWIVFLAGLGALNLFVAFVLFANDTSAWVSFKLFGFTGLFLAFIIGQTFFLSKYMQEEA
ncbi:septation protein A [Massilia sp. TS11]|uniref:septation protein A n=1 Tax=Massilia sp. TS11 TaxID=2908003 RepID=UPI001EDBFEA3|nr:septation protein A [Massilia sp. TS11]MCG2584691.1 septation protein A [Massilia sp. TS11]